jgi:hypothetical protein
MFSLDSITPAHHLSETNRGSRIPRDDARGGDGGNGGEDVRGNETRVVYISQGD